MLTGIRKFIKFTATFAIALILGTLLAVPVHIAAQVLNTKSAGWMGVTLRGGTNPYVAAPAYLKSVNLSSTTSGTMVKNGPGVIACVIINSAGAASSTITLYNATGPVTGYKLATIDATQVGRLFCYGMIFSGALTVAVASGGTAPDVTITYR